MNVGTQALHSDEVHQIYSYSFPCCSKMIKEKTIYFVQSYITFAKIQILDYTPGQWARGVKCVTRTEPFFEGHFPGHPVMPGVLILEALAQTGAVAALSLPENRGKLALFGGVGRRSFYARSSRFPAARPLCLFPIRQTAFQTAAASPCG